MVLTYSPYYRQMVESLQQEPTFNNKQTLFFMVRHGLCFSNGQKDNQGNWLPGGKPFFQPDDDKLTPLGERQIDERAESIALDDRFPKENIIIAASRLTRQWDSAERFARRLGITNIIEFPELREKKPASCYVGKVHDDEEAIRIRKIIKEHKDDPNYHYEDEENEHDVVERLRRGKERWLQLDPNLSVLAVTSGTTIRFWHAVAFEEKTGLNPIERFRDLDNNPNPIINGGYTVYERTITGFNYIPDMYDNKLNLSPKYQTGATYGAVGV